MYEAPGLDSAPTLNSQWGLGERSTAARHRAHLGRVVLESGVLKRAVHPRLVSFTLHGLFVAREIERVSEIPLSCAAVAEFSPAWDAGPILGAAAFDGTIVVDKDSRHFSSLSRIRLERLVEEAYERVAQIMNEQRAEDFPDLSGQTAIVIDDGATGLLAARTAIVAMRNAGAPRVVLVVLEGLKRRAQQLCGAADLTFNTGFAPGVVPCPCFTRVTNCPLEGRNPRGENALS